MAKQKKKQSDGKKSDKDGLTAKQRLFCYEYVKDFNAKRAAKDSGYSEKTSCEIGYENLRKPHIKAKIDALKEEMIESAQINSAMVIQELANIGFSAISDYANIEEVDCCYDDIEVSSAVKFKPFSEVAQRKLRAVKSIKQTKEGIDLRLHSKERALELLGQYLNLWNKEVDDKPVEINVKFDV